MSKTLAIKGDKERGNEVIALLEMMGGSNRAACGYNEDLYYFIGVHNIIDADNLIYDGVIIFTLDEFYEKYPFKVGDKVVYTKYGDNCDDYPVTIESMKWTGTTIEYIFNGCVTGLAKDLKMWDGNPDEVISGIYLNSCDYADEVELYLGDYEIEVRDGKTYAVKKKSVYPKTVADCCHITKTTIDVNTSGHKFDILLNLQRLLICRDAYWKIAGEQMGLGKPWEPDWNNSEKGKHCIFLDLGGIDCNELHRRKCLLAFPTEEMRDAFYENFKDLIEQCKDLL